MDEEKKYLVIRKNKGKFCTIYGDDANIISSLFGYKILNNNKVFYSQIMKILYLHHHHI